MTGPGGRTGPGGMVPAAAPQTREPGRPSTAANRQLSRLFERRCLRAGPQPESNSCGMVRCRHCQPYPETLDDTRAQTALRRSRGAMMRRFPLAEGGLCAVLLLGGQTGAPAVEAGFQCAHAAAKPAQGILDAAPVTGRVHAASPCSAASPTRKPAPATPLPPSPRISSIPAAQEASPTSLPRCRGASTTSPAPSCPLSTPRPDRPRPISARSKGSRVFTPSTSPSCSPPPTRRSTTAATTTTAPTGCPTPVTTTASSISCS